MKAVNLIPAESRKGGGGGVSSPLQYATYGLFGMLAAALALVTLYVLAGNSVSSRQAQLTTLRAEVSQAQAEVARLGSYSQFQALARTRVQTVEGIAAARFDWHSALSDLSRVVPANTSLQSLTGTVVPGAGANGGGGGGQASALRTGTAAPAFELVGCTSSQDDVARLMSRLRLIDGVSRVTLGSSAKTASTSGTTASVSPASSAATQTGCGPDKPNFDVLVFFRPVTGAGPTGITSLATTVSAGGVK